MATGVITENWTMAEGPGGLPRWTVTGLATYDQGTIRNLERNAVRCKFTPVPNQRALVALSLDGVAFTEVAIKPVNYPRITNTVKISPVIWRERAGTQPVGDYAGYAVIEYRVQFQQLRFNHI